MGDQLNAALLWALTAIVVMGEPLQFSRTVDDGPTKTIESFHIKSDIRFRFATTMMTSVVSNGADQAQEIAFEVTLPKEAFLVNFSMAIDGKEYVGEVKEKVAAKRQYEEAVERGQSAGHIRQAPRHSNIFEISVNVANGSSVTFTLTYQELLRRKHGIYEHEIHVNPGQPVDDFSIEIFIQENRDIPYIKTPALRENVLLTNEVEEENELTIIERPTPKTAHILYAPTLKEQGDGGVSARFALQYDVDHSDKGEVLVVDGYFLHFYAPDIAPLPKDIIFVLDVSGSMNGNKIAQLRTSMVAILKDLRPEDRINILTFSSSVRKWKRTLTLADSNTIREATAFVRTMNADGGTNINLALLKALSELRGRELTSRVGMIFFLTDGQPTEGLTDTYQITNNVRQANENSASIFGLAFGSGADFNFLKTICGQNSGFARKIYEASDAALQVASLYDEISAVAMKDVRVEYLPGIKKTTKKEFPVIFNGTEIVICGRFDPNANEEFVANVSGIEKSGEVNVVLDIDDLDEVTMSMDDSLNTFFTMPRDYVGIVEKMWAFLTIKQLLKEKERVAQDEVKAEQIRKEILAMSLKYKFVTPLTSMVVTKPGDEKENEKVEFGVKEDVIKLVAASSMLRRKMSGRRKPHTGSRPYRPASGSQPRVSLADRALGKLNKLNFYKPVFPTVAMMGKFDQGFDMPDIDDINDLLSVDHSTQVLATTSQPPSTSFIRRGKNKKNKSGKKKANSGKNKKNKSGKKKANNQKNGQSKKGKKKSKKQIPVLSSISVESPSLSACIAPHRILNNTYNLLEWQEHNRTGILKISMSVDCLKKCRLLSPKSLNFRYNADTVRINLTYVAAWRYSQDQNLTVRLMGRNQLMIATQEADLIITRTPSKRKLLHDVKVVLKTQHKFKGLLGKVMEEAAAKKQRTKKKRIPKGCRNKKTDVSLKLKKKLATRFMLVPP